MESPLQPMDISGPGEKAIGDELYYMRKEISDLLDRHNSAFPGAQPVSFARRHLFELTKTDYYVCEKSDGMRYLLYLTTDQFGYETHYLIDRKNDFWRVPKDSLHFPKINDMAGFHKNTLIDGELVFDKDPETGSEQPKFLVFDCLVLDGDRGLMKRTLDKRIAYFKKEIFDPYSKMLVELPQEIPHMHFLVELKQMQFSYAVELMFKEILPALPHGNDGLIFTCRTTDYKHGTDHHILKWKPEDENSIDFKLSLDFPLKQPDEVDRSEGVTEPYIDYDSGPVFNLHIYAGDGKEDPWYNTMFVAPAEWEALKALGEPLNDRIVECYMDNQKRWRYMRFRDDKTNANHTSTVESVIESITDRVTKEDLIAAAKGIRDQWKARAGATDRGALAGVKRKADEQGRRDSSAV